jgi:predicted phosphate transport protein (TIGR00153 family)
MFARLFPSEGKDFFGLFERHVDKTVEAARLLRAMLNNPVDLADQARRIKELEHEGDVITHRAVEILHRTFITPIDRGDIHRLISRLDDVLDLIEATSERVWLYGIDTSDNDANDLAEVLVNAVSEVSRAMRGLRDLKNRDAILQVCMEINRYENEGDTLLRRAVARLFRDSKDPMMVIKWKDIYEFLEDAIDRCEDIANVVEGVALEYA